MYRKKYKLRTSISVNTGITGESVERKIERMVNNGEPMENALENVPLIYTDKKEGVGAGYNIKTDRFEVAVDAVDKVNKGKIAKREGKAKAEAAAKGKSDVEDSGAESIDGGKSD